MATVKLFLQFGIKAGRVGEAVYEIRYGEGSKTLFSTSGIFLAPYPIFTPAMIFRK